MRILLSVMVLGCLMLAGCAHNRPAQTQAGFASLPSSPYSDAASNQKLIITPETGLTGKVVRVNSTDRFVVLNFPIGHLPVLDERLNVYRLGLKVGEVKVTGPQMDDNVVGDLVAGDANVGDEVRDR